MGGLFRLATFIFLLWIAFRLLRFLFGLLKFFFKFRIVTRTGRPSGGQAKNSSRVAEMARDPMCGAYISVEHSIQENFKGERHYFCSAKCLEDYRVKIHG